MSAVYLVVVFIVASLLGYKLISNVPSLLHTPLMSGLNALSGVTVLGAMAAMATGNRLLAALAVVLAMVNLVGGFAVTDRMLKMFSPKHKKKSPPDGNAME